MALQQHRVISNVQFDILDYMIEEMKKLRIDWDYCKVCGMKLNDYVNTDKGNVCPQCWQDKKVR